MQEFPKVKHSTGSTDVCKQHNEPVKMPTQPALTKTRASGPELAIRKPAASGSRLAQRQDSEEEARSAGAEVEDRTGRGKYWLEKAAQLENNSNNKTEEQSRRERQRDSNIRGKHMLRVAEEFGWGYRHVNGYYGSTNALHY